MINTKTLYTLEYPKILSQLAQLTSFAAGRELAEELLPSTDLDEARSWQRETAEALDMLEKQSQMNLSGARDVRDVAINAQRGVVIDPGVLLDIRYTLRRAAVLKRSLAKQKGQYPLLAEIADEMLDCQTLQDSIANAINDNAEVKDTASPRLAVIRRDLKIAFERLQSKLNRIITNKNNQNLLQDAMITMRSGRYVVPLKAEHKGKIKGVTHDTSSSGATLFIEPLETVELNNEWRELQIQEEKEIRRILAALTDEVGANSEDIVRDVEILGYLDFTQAKAEYALKLNAAMPRLLPFNQKKKGHPQHPGSSVYLKSARHPLLMGDVVPIDVEFDTSTWVLVVTGPNTGGKTVALKTVGLLSLMAQSGLHLPAEEAELSVFEGIYSDIGDEQSIEQSLSTFSSHMTNIIAILKECDDRSLVILDEVGAGTDPAEGSALARALLNRLLNMQVTTMVSTHHPELKIYAVETPGVRNASVEFNLETLAPTYRLIIGLPGRSNALAIASRLGLDAGIIDQAKGMVATEDLIADDLLDEIQRTRKQISDESETIASLRTELQAQRDNLQARLDKIEDERRDVVRAARRNAEEELEDFRKQLKKMQSEMKVAGMPLEKIQALQTSANKMQSWTQGPIDEGEVEQIATDDWKPKLGDTVYLDSLNAEGTIVEMDAKAAQVQVGTLRVRAKYSELRKRNRSERRVAERGHKREYEPSDAPAPQVSSPGMELDLRGQRVEEALEELDRYIDAAYLSGLPFGRIIHGKGTGRLRQAVRDYLMQHALVSKVTGAEANEGGAGVTIVHMVPTT
jgi:DNA mismatch repair protein MutS2